MIATLIQFLLPLPWLRGLGRPAAARARRAGSGREAVLQADAPGDAWARADQRQCGDRHVRRGDVDRPDDRPERDRQGVPDLHAPAGDVLRRRRDRALPLARATRGARDVAGFRDTVSRGLRQINFLLLPAAAASIVLAEPIVRLLYERGAFDPDETVVVAQCSVRVLDRPRVQRDDAAFEPRLLQPAAPVDSDRSLRSASWIVNVVLYVWVRAVRGVGDPAWRSRSRTSSGVGPPRGSVDGDASAASAFTTPRARSYSSRSHRSCSPPSPTPSGGRSTKRSAAHCSAQIVSVGTALLVGGAAYLAAARLLRVRELAALLSLRGRSTPDG